MGQTSHGIPYPVGTDRLMDGDDSIKALAEFVDGELFNRPRGKVYLSTTSGTLTPNAWTSFGTGLSYAYTKGGVVGVTPSQLRVPRDGLYRITAQMYFSTASSTAFGNRRGVRVHLNGATATGILEGVNSGITASIGPITVLATNEVELKANDTLALAWWHNQTGANLTAVGATNGAYTYMTVHYLSATT